VTAATGLADARAPRTLRVGPRGASLAVEVAGAGPPILLLHGFTGSTRTLDGVGGGLRAAGYRTIAVDALGHGASDAPPAAAAYRLERAAAGLVDVLDALCVPRAAVFGYSMGGRTALGLAVLHPARVRALVVVGASAGLADPAARAARRRADEALAAAILRDGVPAFVERWMANPLFATQARLGPAALAAARAQRLANRADGLALSLRGLGTGAQPPLHAELRGLEAPLLAIAGEEDAKFRALAAELAALAPRGRAAVIAGAGHAAHLEAPAATLREVCRFLASLPVDDSNRHSRGTP